MYILVVGTWALQSILGWFGDLGSRAYIDRNHSIVESFGQKF